MLRPFKHLLLVAVAASSLLANQPIGDLAKGPYRAAVIGDFLILVPTTAKQKKVGLKTVRDIPPSRGMLLRRGGNPVVVTAKDCPSPMDLVFIGRDGVIQNVVKAPAHDLATTDPRLFRYMALGSCTKADLPELAPEIPPTAFLVAVRAGEGPRFAQAWRADMVDVLTYKDLTNPVQGF